MSDSALKSQGMLFQVDISSTLTTIPELSNIQGPGGSATIIDVTDLSSLGKEKRVGLQDLGQIQCDMNFIPKDTTHEYIRAAKASGSLESFRIIFTDDGSGGTGTGATTWDFDGFISQLSISNAVDSVTRGQLVIEVSGAITPGTVA